MTLVEGFRRTAPAAAVLTLTVGLVHPSGAPSQRSVERPLTVDFYALGADGTSVADLRPGDVTIKVDGRPRAVQSLRLVQQGDVPGADPLGPRPTAAPPPFDTNRVADAGRSFVVVIDDESFRPGHERPIRAALNIFLESLTPRDRVSLWTMPHGGMKVNLTSDHDRVSEAVRLVTGRGPDRETGSDGACRTRLGLEAMENMLSTMTGGEGPTTVIVLTASMYGPRRDNIPSLMPGMCELTTEHFLQLGRMAASARAHFYIVQPEDVAGQGSLATEGIAGTGFKGSENPLEGLENLAGITGGTRLSLMRAGDASLVTIARATASYYSAVVDGSSSDIAGPHRLDVKVSRSGVDVRSRAVLDVRKPTGVSPQPKTPAEMVRVGTAFSDLHMRVSGFSSLNGGDGQMRVIAAAEPVEPTVTFTAMSVALFDTFGRMVGQVNASPAELATRPALAALVVPRGTYRLRVAAADAGGRTGAVDTEIVAEMVQAGSLKLSSLVLGLSPGGVFQPRLQFSDEPVAVAVLDLYGGTRGMAVGAILEIAQTLNGPALAVTRLTVEAAGDAGRFTAMGTVSIAALPPGDYVARVIAGIEGQPHGRVVRAFRKVGSPGRIGPRGR